MSISAIQQVIDNLANRLHRSVVVDDPQVRLLFSSRHFGDEDEVRRRAMLQRDAGSRTIGYVLSQGVSTWTTAGVIPANEELGLHTRVCVPIRWHATLLGLLMVVDSEGTLTTGELSQITEVSHELAALLLGEQPDALGTAEQEVADALDDLFATEPTVRRAAVRSLAHRVGDDTDRHVRVLLLRAEDGQSPSSPGHMAAGFRHALSSEGARPFAWNIVSAVRDSSTAVLVSSRAEIVDEALTGYAQQLVTRVAGVAGDHFRCVAGVGGQVEGLDRAHHSHRQAALAARAAHTLMPGPVVRWNDLGEYAVLLQLPLEQLGEDALPDEVRRLVEHDKDGREIDTVRAFLDHAGSAPDTAEALHVHRTTLYYRLERIREATGLDLDDGRTRLVLHLGLRLRDLLGIRHL